MTGLARGLSYMFCQTKGRDEADTARGLCDVRYGKHHHHIPEGLTYLSAPQVCTPESAVLGSAAVLVATSYSLSHDTTRSVHAPVKYPIAQVCQCLDGSWQSKVSSRSWTC